LRHRARLPTRWLRGWVALVTIGCIYITGEEVACGQYVFGWNPPEWWPSGETNLHAFSEADPKFYWWASFFNEKPRLLLEAFVLFGIIRVLMQRGDVEGGDWRAWFWQTYVCLPSAILAILARVPERMDRLGYGYSTLLFDPGLLNWQSLQELFFSLFLFVYLLSIWYRGKTGSSQNTTHSWPTRASWG
jgi:hypothetical protein